MKAIDFITLKEFNEISQEVKNREEFHFKKEIKKISICLDSSKAGCDFSNSETKKGDYIVDTEFGNYNNGFTGFGEPLERAEYEKIFSNYKNLLAYIDSHVKKYAANYQEVTENDIEIATITD
ncbi:MAG: hypothetical protein M0R51_17720, partial [Clostridia bacterium]|nr:hypothetical protein [Clostridia bacterium]